MSETAFKAMVVKELADKTFERSIETKSIDQLPVGEVLVKVMYSSLNYKDALSASGNRGVTRSYPHTPGIDCSGVVEATASEDFQVGDKVIVTSYDLGMNTSGGFGQYVRVPGEWVVPLPEGLTLRESMVYGTAGFTAAMSVFALTQKIPVERGEILVTGATGGVGTLAVALLARLGYQVAGVSGKPDALNFLQQFGVKKVITREVATEGNERPVLKPQWAGVVDTVGGDILAAAIKSTDAQGVVTCCGNVASPDLPINVFPFILRGVSLAGIDSQNCPMAHRRMIWKKMATEWKPEGLEKLCREVTLDGLGAEIDLILQGGQTGRVIVNMAE
ncbi:MAG: YhdH/YhfP family quinone oxidoreductase [Desulfobulbaceae bacterium]|nr:YhdH/YhfP family quinone oxidoreductase [Desulfobulbaceae bacterium]